MKKYKTIRSKIIFKNKFMSLTEDNITPVILDKRKISSTTKISRFYRLDFSDWVNVIAIDKRYLLVFKAASEKNACARENNTFTRGTLPEQLFFV